MWRVVATVKGLRNAFREEYSERGTYDNKRMALLALLGYSIGLGNFWRFPYLCHVYGVTFLVPYLVFAVVLVLPLSVLEALLGQYVSRGPIKVFAYLCPILSGVGSGMVACMALVTVYYAVVMSWALRYMAASFSEPWRDWDNDTSTHTTDHCLTKETLDKADEYFKRDVIGEGSGIWVNGWLVLCLAVTWVLVAVFLARGIQHSAKVLYFTILLPYVIQGLLLFWLYERREKSACTDIKFNIDFSSLKNATIWIDAATQAIFSMGTSYGAITTLTSYNTLQHNTLRDVLILFLVDTASAVFSGYIMGLAMAMWKNPLPTNQDKKEVVFVMFSAVLSLIEDVPCGLAVFFMMLLFGLDSQFAMMETVITALFDQFEVLRQRHLYVVLVTCLVLFICGLPMCATNFGLNVLHFLDDNLFLHSFFLLAFLEVVAVCHIFGYKEFMTRVERDMNIKIPKVLYHIWRVSLRFVIPILLLVLFIASMYKSFEGWSWLGQLLAFTPLIIVVVHGVFKVCRRRHDQSVRDLLTHTKDFCPEYERRPCTRVEDNTRPHTCRSLHYDNEAFQPT